MNSSKRKKSEIARSYPLTSGCVLVRQRKDGVLVYDRAIKKTLSGNADFVELLSLCDGTRMVDDIVLHIAHERGEDTSSVGTEILLIIDRLRDDGLISLSYKPCPCPVIVRCQKTIFPLNTVYVETTRRCNLRCIHCYASSPTFSKTPDRELPTSKWLKIIDDVANSGAMNICFTGGEPFVRADICELLLRANRKGLETAVFTNGVALTDSDIDVLVEIGPKFIAVGMDSHLAQIYRQVRGSDSWSKVTNNIKKMVSHNLHLRLRLNCVLLRGINDSLNDIEGYLHFASELGLGADDVTFDEFCPEGEGTALLEHCVNEMELMERIAREFRDIFGIEYRQRPTENEEEHERWSFCGIGTDMCYITHDAKVALCPALTSDAFIAGELKHASLTQLWDQSEVFEFFRKYEYLLGSKCQSCPVLATCKAGCRAKACTFEGTMASHDPWMCAYFKQ